MQANMDSTFGSNQAGKKAKQRRRPQGDGFFEALGEIGRSITGSVKNDLLKGTAQNVHDQLIGASKGKAPDEKQEDFDFAEWIHAKENEIAQDAEQEGRVKERAFQKARSPEHVIFSLADERVKQEVEGVLQEIKLLAETMQNVEAAVEKAIIQEVVNPGVYHLNYFEKIKQFLRTFRKSLQEGELWLEMWKSRSQRSVFWKGFKNKGSQYMFSQERQSSFAG